MTTKQAKQLLVGTIVMWDNDPNDLGTVRTVGFDGFFVDWQKGQKGWIAYQDAKKVSIR